MKRLLLALVAMACVAFAAEARQPLKRTFTSSTGLNLPYQVVYPDDFNPAGRYPLLLFLHGAGERGNDNELQMTHGGEMLTTAEELAGVIVVVPQCPEGEWWADIDHNLSTRNLLEMNPAPAITAPMQAVEELLGALFGLDFVDRERVYGVGLSMGAMGIWELVCRHPDLFTAVQPICGAVNTSVRLAAYEGPTHFRIIHGADDPIVPADCSHKAAEVLQSNGKPAELVMFDGCGHLSWNPAFAMSDFLGWMLSKSK